MPARAVRLPLVAALLVALAATAGPVSAQSIEDARRERAAIQERLDDAAASLADLEARTGALADESDRLADDVTELEARASEAEARVAERVRDLYKRGVDTPILQLITGDDADAALERAELAGHLLAGDRVEIETAVAARTRADAVAEELADRRAELDAAREEQQAVLAALREDLDRAAALEERLVEEERQRQAEARRRAEEEARRQAEAARRAEEREQAAAAAQAPSPEPEAATPAPEPAAPEAPPPPPAPSGGGRACPVGQPHSFTDTWGAPRSGGRSHQGVDILANYGTPVYAIVSGVWDVRSFGRSAGHWAILRGDDGHTYYYMHLQSHTVGDGARVGAGQQTGTVGDTGNATGTPHLHFEYHPGGGGAVNPYPIARDAC